MMTEHWVFGYGSLMWRPGFEFTERHPARLYGLHRALCIYSHVHRGTPERPGLVLGLDSGGACRGVAFKVAPERWDDTVAYLREREQITMVYREIVHPVHLLDAAPRQVPALTYVVDHAHPQYAGKLSLEEQLRFARQGHGLGGPCGDYIANTVAHLEEMGIRDHTLETLHRRLAAG